MTQGQCFSLLSLLICDAASHCCLESFPAGSNWSFLGLQHELIGFFILLDTIGAYCVLSQWIYGALLPLQSLVWMSCLPLLAWVMWFVAGHGCVGPFSSAGPHVANPGFSLWPWCPIPAPGSLGQGGHLLLYVGVVGMSSWLDDLCCWGFALFVKTDVLHRLQVSMLSPGLWDASCPASWVLVQSRWEQHVLSGLCWAWTRTLNTDEDVPACFWLSKLPH